MKRNLIQGTLLLLFALIVCTSAAAVVTEDTVTRDLPATAAAGTTITVDLTVDVESGATFYAIDDTVPTGWTVTSATSGGDYTADPGHVKWVVTSGAADTVYSYTVLVPATASGTYTFDGIYAFEGMTAEATILGDTDVDVTGGGVTEDTVTRNLPSTADAGTAIAVNLTVDIESGATFYAIDETVPTGWTVTSATSGGDYTADPGHVKWVVTSGAADTVYSYTVLVPTDASGMYTFDGIYMFEGMTAEATILGDTTVNVTGSADGTPFDVGGHVYYPNATTVSGADVTVTNLNTSESLTTTTDSNGAYVVNLGNLPGGHNAGDLIQVTATYNGQTGTNSAPRSENLSDSPQIIDVTLSTHVVQIKAEDGGNLPDSIPVGETFTVLITEDGISVGAGTNVTFRLPYDTGDPVLVQTDDDGKARYTPLITGTLGIRVLNGTATVAEATVNVITVAEDTVTRDLPATANASTAIAVNLTVDVESGATFYAIDETVSSGWTVTSATDGGDYTSEAGHVKWVLTSGAADTVYSYTVLVPATASGTYTFDGIYAFEGMAAEATILGDTDVDVGCSDVVMSITDASASPNCTTTTQITITNMTNFGASTVTLSYDPGVVQITDVTAGDVGTPTANINNTAGTATIAAYVSTVTGPDSPITFANLELTAIGSSGETSPLTLGIITLADANGTSMDAAAQSGVFVVNGTVDTVTRDLPSTTGAGTTIAVNLTVDVESGARYYAIDETVPTGWTVTSATDGGDYTSETGHVKWVVTSGAADTVYSYTVLVPADASGTYTFDGIYMFEGMTAEATIIGNTTVNVSVSPPTLVTYTITNTTITPPQTTSIDVRFSERVSAIIKIEDASGNLVNELYTSTGVTDPSSKTWDGTYTNGTTVPDGTYTVNVSGVSTTTGLSVIDTSKTITVGEGEVPTVSIGSAEGSVGDTVNVSINITNASMIGAMDIRVTYNASILNATGVANGSMIENLPAPLVACNLIPGAINISFVTYPDAIDGDGELFVVTFDVVGGDTGESSVLDIEADAYTTDVPPQYVYMDTANGSFVVNSSAASTVSFDPLDSRTYTSSTTTVNLTLDSVPDGLSGYNLTVSLSNQSIAEILSVRFPAWATLHDNFTLPADSVWLKAADLMGSVGSGDTNISLGTLTIRGNAEGVCDIMVTVTDMDDDDGDPINPGTVSGTINVTSVIALPDHDNPPTDPDSDGVYEDLNGNDRIDFDDVVQYFKYMEWIEENEPISCFDFNGNGRINFDDIVALFEEV